MSLYDWLLLLHLVGVLVASSAMVSLWAIVFATQGTAPLLNNQQAMRIGNIAGPLVGAGMMIALVFGVWLSFQVDAYHLWDAWIVASLVLWLAAGASGAQSGKTFAKNDASLRSKAIALQGVNTAAIVAILILMIWKPGA